jgi:hypothetical protein
MATYETYETIYSVGLLDDIHNYFPDILYHPSRFITVPEVLLYVQQCVQQRFNLLEHGRRRANTRNTFVEEVTPTRVPQVLFSFAGLSGLAGLAGLSGQSGLSGLAGLRATNLSNLFQDVAVHASQTIIDGASTVTTLDQDTEENCSICQDRMRQGEIIRTLTACTHAFHKSCLDNWLLHSSVRCPSCRHDIREPAPTH